MSDIMQSQTPIPKESEGAVDAFKRITKEGVGRLAALDKGERLVGIISKTDFVHAVQVKMVGVNVS